MLNYKNFKKDTGGNVAMMFAVSTLTLLIAIGAAIDYTNISRARSALQSQVDAAVLAAATVEVESQRNGNGHAYGRTDENFAIRESAAREVIQANGFDLTGVNPVVSLNENSVVVRAELNYQPFFGGILGRDNVRLVAESESGLPGMTRADIVLVLDNTRSMKFDGKLNALKTGAIALVDAVEDSGSESKIGLVPFARYVRVNDSARTASWFQMPVEFDTPRTFQQASASGGTCTTENRTRTVDGIEETYEANICTGQTVTHETQNTVIESRWEGCVGTRVPPYSERDDAYSHRIPGLLNNTPRETTALSFDRRVFCPAEINELTDNYSTLRSRINGMWTTDNTYLPSGLIWGQRVLSPGEPYDNAPEEGVPPNRQVMVLMTDGHNTTEIMQDSSSVTYLNAPPFIGSVDDDERATAADAATARLCESVKAEGIDVYTIAFQVTDMTTKDLLKNCASDPEKALTADNNEELITEFGNIANRLEAEIRLMR